jgi:hypothetical protein
MNSEEVGRLVETLGILFAFAAGLAIVAMWIVFPFMVRNRLDKLVDSAEHSRRHLFEIDVAMNRLVAQTIKPTQTPNKPTPPTPTARATKMVTCECRNCSKPMQFDANNFDPNTPPTIPCPHCGTETELYMPETPTGI